jgi:hypothetical protein
MEGSFLLIVPEVVSRKVNTVKAFRQYWQENQYPSGFKGIQNVKEIKKDIFSIVLHN